MPTVGVGFSLRIHGTKEGIQKAALFRTTMGDQINEALREEIGTSEENLRDLVQSAYTTGEGSGRTARSLELEVRPGKRGASVRLRVGVYRHTKYLTTLLPESDFKETPYPIFAKNAQWLRFFMKRGEPPGIRFAKVVWHPGFRRDALREAGQIELERLGNIVQLQVSNVVTSIFQSEPNRGATAFEFEE